MVSECTLRDLGNFAYNSSDVVWLMSFFGTGHLRPPLRITIIT